MAPAGGKRPTLRRCPRHVQEGQSFVCVDVELPGPGLAACTALQGRIGSPARFPADFGGSPAQVCSGHCRVFVHDLQPGRTYRAFCAQLGSEGSERPASVFPECVAGNPLQDCGIDVSTLPGFDPEHGHETFGITSLFGSLLLIVYMVWSFRFEHVHGVHETAVAVVVGLVLGFVVYFIYGETPVFNYETFSYFVLPMVIFDAGFNLEKTRFFWYASQIASLGIVGTVTIFLLIFFSSGLSDMFPDIFQTLSGAEVELSVQQRLTMASVLSSTDTVAPIAFLPKDCYPRLFAIVFGEGVLNDVVAILLSTSVTESPELPSLAQLSGKICYYLVTSSVMGLSFGFAVSYVFKHSQWLHEEVVHPCALMLLLNYICYVLTEMCDFSSIFALFLSSLLCGHYAQSALSEEAQEFADQISEFLAYCAEAFVFGYFGLTAVGYLMEPDHFSPSLIVFYSMCIILARAITVTLVAVFLRCFRLHHLSLKWNHMCVIMMAGCMRGTIAYALILRAVPPAGLQSKQEVVMVSTVLGIVLLNCLVFGALFPVVMRCLGIEPMDGAIPKGISFSYAEAAAEASHHYRMRSRLHAAWSHFDNSKLKPLLRKDWSHPEPARKHTVVGTSSSPEAELAEDRKRCRTCSI